MESRGPPPIRGCHEVPALRHSVPRARAGPDPAALGPKPLPGRVRVFVVSTRTRPLAPYRKGSPCLTSGPAPLRPARTCLRGSGECSRERTPRGIRTKSRQPKWVACAYRSRSLPSPPLRSDASQSLVLSLGCQQAPLQLLHVLAQCGDCFRRPSIFFGAAAQVRSLPAIFICAHHGRRARNRLCGRASRHRAARLKRPKATGRSSCPRQLRGGCRDMGPALPCGHPPPLREFTYATDKVSHPRHS